MTAEWVGWILLGETVILTLIALCFLVVMVIMIKEHYDAP